MTIAGFHTKHELSELVENLDGFVQAMIGAIKSGFDAWSANDAMAAATWKADWEVFYPRWYAAATTARAAVGSETFWDVTTDEPAYQALLIAYNPGDGDEYGFPDLDRRLRAANTQGAPAAPVYIAKQPTAPDADLGAYQAADAGVKAIQATVAAAQTSLMPSTTTLVVAGLAAAVLLGIVFKVAK